MAEQLKEHIKDPGSAITHFIGMLMAIFAAIPLLLKAAREPGKIYIIAIAVYAASLILLYAASTTYHTFDKSKNKYQFLKNRSHDDQCSHRRKLHSDLPVSTWRQDRNHPSCDRMVICHRRNPDQSILGILSEMDFIRTLYRHGLDLRTGIYTIAEFLKPGGFRMAAGRWYHLHCWRCDLCFEASDL